MGQGSLLTVAKREIITIGKEETQGKYPGGIPGIQTEKKLEIAMDLQSEEGLIGIETGNGDEEGILATPTQKEKILICQDCSMILVPGSVLDEDGQEEKLLENAKSIEPLSSETRSGEESRGAKPLDEIETSEIIEIGKKSLEKIVQDDVALDTKETQETNQPFIRAWQKKTFTGDGPDSVEEAKEAVTNETITICEECQQKKVANEEIIAEPRVSSLTPHHMSEYPDDIRESIEQAGLDAILDARRQP